MDKMITFFMNFPLFEEMNKEIVFTIVTRSRYMKVSTKETISKQGDMPKMVYFIRSGKLKIIKKIKLKNTPHLKKLSTKNLKNSSSQ